MLPITEQERERIRAAQAATLTGLCQRVRISYGQGTGGLPTLNEEDVASFPCRVQTLRVRPGSMAFDGVQEGDIITIVTVPYGSDVKAGDILHVGGRRLRVSGVADLPAWHGPSAVRCYCNDYDLGD